MKYFLSAAGRLLWHSELPGGRPKLEDALKLFQQSRNSSRILGLENTQLTDTSYLHVPLAFMFVKSMVGKVAQFDVEKKEKRVDNFSLRN